MRRFETWVQCRGRHIEEKLSRKKDVTESKAIPYPVCPRFHLRGKLNNSITEIGNSGKKS